MHACPIVIDCVQLGCGLPEPAVETPSTPPPLNPPTPPAALDLLNPECKVTNEETGEMELDFEFITYDALMAVGGCLGGWGGGG